MLPELTAVSGSQYALLLSTLPSLWGRWEEKFCVSTELGTLVPEANLCSILWVVSSVRCPQNTALALLPWTWLIIHGLDVKFDYHSQR